jgi:hypothetical protein
MHSQPGKMVGTKQSVVVFGGMAHPVAGWPAGPVSVSLEVVEPWSNAQLCRSRRPGENARRHVLQSWRKKLQLVAQAPEGKGQRDRTNRPGEILGQKCRRDRQSGYLAEISAATPDRPHSLVLALRCLSGRVMYLCDTHYCPTMFCMVQWLTFRVQYGPRSVLRGLF